jgi:microcystin-dependent protein
MRSNCGDIAGGMPSGMILPYIGLIAPAGYLLCDGSSQLVEDFPILAEILNYSHGGSGANFNLPDSRGRVITFKDGGRGILVNSQGNIIGGGTSITYGLQNHQLITAELFPHTHVFSISDERLLHTHTLPAWSYIYDEYGTPVTTYMASQRNAYSNTTQNSESSDIGHNHTQGNASAIFSNTEHNNTQPCYICTRMIKI